MTRVRLSPAGEHLVASNQYIASILPAFALEELDLREVGDTKSYRNGCLGTGVQGEVFAVGETNVAEKVWRHEAKSDHPRYSPGATFDRHLAIREHWKKEKPGESKIYVPEYFAVVERPTNLGAILMERLNGTPADQIVAARAKSLPAKPVAESLGVEPERLIDAAIELRDLIRSESDFYHSLFHVVPLPEVDPGPRNMLVEYDTAAGVITRLAVIDL